MVPPRVRGEVTVLGAAMPPMVWKWCDPRGCSRGRDGSPCRVDQRAERGAGIASAISCAHHFRSSPYFPLFCSQTFPTDNHESLNKAVDMNWVQQHEPDLPIRSKPIEMACSPEHNATGSNKSYMHAPAPFPRSSFCDFHTRGRRAETRLRLRRGGELGGGALHAG